MIGIGRSASSKSRRRSHLRRFLTAALCLPLVAGLLVDDAEAASKDEKKTINAFLTDSWLGQTLSLQKDLSLDVPLTQVTMYGTHNSYASRAYGYSDPQQYYTILQQLRLGAQFIELDLQIKNSNEVALCHGTCTAGNRQVHEGTKEIKVFLEQAQEKTDPYSKNRIIIIYIEDNVGEDYHQNVYEQIYGAGEKGSRRHILGRYIYADDKCNPLPAKGLTARDILQSGYQVVVWKDGYCSGDRELRGITFTGLGGMSRDWESEIVAADIEKVLERVAKRGLGGPEDEKGRRTWSPEKVAELIERGVNLMTHDNLRIEATLNAMAWSWDKDRPDNAGGLAGDADCAYQKNKARWGEGHVWDDGSCSAQGVFACQNEQGEWRVTTSQGRWPDGEATCVSEYGADGFFFSVPVNAKDNLALTNAKPEGAEPWLNLTDQAKEGRWVARHRWNRGGAIVTDGGFDGNYIIRNTWRCPDDIWCNANLSWDTKEPHPEATVEGDGFAWEIKPIAGKPDHYTIRNKWRCDLATPNKWCDAELSWDRIKDGHPLATVELNDHVEWKIVPDPKGKRGHYLIQNTWGCSDGEKWCNANLSWDRREGTHPRASVEKDKFTWQILKVN